MRNVRPTKALPVTDSVSFRIARTLRKAASRRFAAFTLAELVVVITILAILATVGFLALSGYTQDAKDSAIKANVRSVQTAISSEAALSNNSPRYYVVHDSGAALSWAFVYVDSNQTALTGGAWNESGTNYSAGNPDYAKLKLNPEKFRVSGLGISNAVTWAVGFSPFGSAEAAYDARYLTVGAMDASTGPTGGSKKRSVSYFQVAGISPATWTVSIAGNYPASSGSVAGLVKAPGTSEALVDGGKAGTSVGCVSGTVSWYAVPALAHGASVTVSKPTLSWTGLTIGTKSGNASCSFASVSVSDVSVSCVSWWVEGPSLSCVQDVCGGTIADTNAHSTATSQSVSGNWARSAAPGLCTWDCDSDFGWDSATSTCKASVNGVCGTAAKTYAYLDSSFWTDAYCGLWTVSVSPSFPAAGASATWTCSGLWNGAASTTCTAYRGSCAANPSFANLGTLTVGNPVATATSWTYSATPANCTYSCAAGYSGTNCLTQSIVGNDASGRTWADGSHAESCKEYRNGNGNKTYAGSTGDGVYWIDPDGAGAITGFKVLCDMTSDGGGWTIIGESLVNSTSDTSRPFNVGWNALKTAWVGTMMNPDTNFHISMDRYLAMANSSKQVDYAWYAKSGKPTDPWQRTIQYSNHYLANDGYFTWNGTSVYALNSLVAYNGVKLTTFDSDNDSNTSGNCADPAIYWSFGWYTTCHAAHLWSQTPEWSATCAPWAVEAVFPSGPYVGSQFVRWGTAVCNGYSNRWPDAAGSYNTWYELKIMIR